MRRMAIHVSKGWLYGVSLLLTVALLAACGRSAERGSPTPSDPLIAKGAALYKANCQICHGGATGGKLRDIPPPHNANGHTWDHADQQIIDMALNGISFSLEAQRMPAFKDKLSEEDVRAVLAYIKTWWTEEQRQWQANVTAQWDR